MNTVDDVVASAVQASQTALPDLRSNATLLVFSDYSGQHKGSRFEAYSYIFTGLDHWPHWEGRRLHLRKSSPIGDRRLSFKSLGDRRKRAALREFLAAADDLPGLCLVVVVDRSIRSLFQKSNRLEFNDEELQPFSHYGRVVFERLLRVVHFLSLFIAGLSRPGQNLLWFTDQDDIAANDDRVTELTRILGNVASHYLQHDLGHLRCGTTACDNGSLQIEDLVAIADLAGGVGVELANRYRAEDTMPTGSIIVPAPASLSMKAKGLLAWMCRSNKELKRLVLLLEPVPLSTAVRVKYVRLHSIGLGAG